MGPLGHKECSGQGITTDKLKFKNWCWINWMFGYEHVVIFVAKEDNPSHMLIRVAAPLKIFKAC